jgi:hypothetical protein
MRKGYRKLAFSSRKEHLLSRPEVKSNKHLVYRLTKIRLHVVTFRARLGHKVPSISIRALFKPKIEFLFLTLQQSVNSSKIYTLAHQY